MELDLFEEMSVWSVKFKVSTRIMVGKLNEVSLFRFSIAWQKTENVRGK